MMFVLLYNSGANVLTKWNLFLFLIETSLTRKLDIGVLIKHTEGLFNHKLMKRWYKVIKKDPIICNRFELKKEFIDSWAWSKQNLSDLWLEWVVDFLIGKAEEIWMFISKKLDSKKRKKLMFRLTDHSN